MVSNPQALFVYGTLRNDLSKRAMSRLPIGDRQPATLNGAKLLNTGWYPCAVPVEEAVTQGQFVDLAEIDTQEWDRIIGHLDAYEGAPGLFNRRIEPVTLSDGTETQAWVYWYSRPEAAYDYPPVPSNDWKEYIENA